MTAIIMATTLKKRRRFIYSWLLKVLFCFVLVSLSFRTQVVHLSYVTTTTTTSLGTNDPTTTAATTTNEIKKKHHHHHHASLLTRGLPDALVTEIIADFDVMTGCGYFKCFFPSRTKDTVGWLVTRARRYYQSQHQALNVYNFAVQAYDFALAREASHGMRHYYLQPPFLTGRLSAANTNLLVTKFNTTLCNNPRTQTKCRLVPRGASHGFVVQKLRRASVHAILAKLWVNDDNNNNYQEDTNNNNHNTSTTTTTTTTTTTPTLTLQPPLHEIWSTLVDRTTFVHNLQADLQQTRHLVHDYPALQVDFQFMIDPTTGYIYHLDLDRLFDADLNPSSWRDKFAAVQHVVPACLNALEQQVLALWERDKHKN